MNTSTRKAFTLIELLVVISIIALLMSILMPALGKAKEKAQMVICASNQRQLIISIFVYSTDNDNLLPPHTTEVARANLLSRRNSPNDTYQYKYLGGYLPDVGVFNCPVSGFKDDMDINIGGNNYTYQELYRDGYDLGAQLPCSYMLYWNYISFDKVSLQSANSDNKYGETFVGPGKKSRNTLLVSDSFYYSGALGGTVNESWHSSHMIGGSGKSINDRYPYFVLPGIAAELDFDTNPDLRNVTLNAGYLDGSVTSFKSRDTIKQQAVSGWAISYLPAKWR